MLLENHPSANNDPYVLTKTLVDSLPLVLLAQCHTHAHTHTYTHTHTHTHKEESYTSVIANVIVRLLVFVLVIFICNINRQDLQLA